MASLLHEHDLPVVEAHAENIAVVAEVHEKLARALLLFAGEVGKEVQTINVVLKCLPIRLVTSFLQLSDDIRLACHSQEGWQPVVMWDDLIRDGARLDLAGPADDHRHSEGTFPVCVLLTSE